MKQPKPSPDVRACSRKVFDSDEAITFQVSVLSNLIARPFHAHVGRHTGMSLSDWRLLIVIANHPGLSQTQIIHATGFNKASVSRQLNNLSKFVRLESHPVDNRKQAVFLTDAGWEIYEQGVPALLWRQELLTRSLPEKELAQFKKTLQKLVAAARKWSVTLDDEKRAEK